MDFDLDITPEEELDVIEIPTEYMMSSPPSGSMPLTEIEERAELGKFVFNMVLNKADLVFIRSNIRLQSTVDFSQYLFDEKKLITLIGEEHEKSFPCKDPQLSLGEYALRMVNRNPNSKVLLEQVPNFPLSRNTSRNIREVGNTLINNGKQSHLVYFDIRFHLIGDKGMDVIYNDNVSKYTPIDLGRMLIDPVYANWGKIFYLNPAHYTPDGYSYLTHAFIPDINNSFVAIANKLRINDMVDVNEMFKDTFKKITDFFVLREIMKNDNIDEYIILVGDMHRYNLQKIFNLWMFTMMFIPKRGQSGKCVNLFETYRLEN